MHSKRPWKPLGTQNWDGEFPDGLTGAARPSASEVASSSANLDVPPQSSDTEAGASVLYTSDNVERLATIVQSEASAGNRIERIAVAWTVINRMKSSGAEHVREVERAYSRDDEPTDAMRELAHDVLSGKQPDPTGGCTHYYSPRSMPKEGQDTEGVDVSGGLELVPPQTQQNYRPGWAADEAFTYHEIPGVRPQYFRFYKASGAGRQY